jgi:hypothetical protein
VSLVYLLFCFFPIWLSAEEDSIDTKVPRTIAQGISQNHTGTTASSIRYYRNVIAKNVGRKDGALAMPYYRLAMIYWEQNNGTAADEEFRNSLNSAKGKNVVPIAVDFVTFLLEQGNAYQAEIICNNVLSRVPNEPQLLRLLAQCHVWQGKIIQAMRYYRSIGDTELGYQEIALLLRSMGDIDSALAMESKIQTSKQPSSAIMVVAQTTEQTVPMPPKPISIRKNSPSRSISVPMVSKAERLPKPAAAPLPAGIPPIPKICVANHYVGKHDPAIDELFGQTRLASRFLPIREE